MESESNIATRIMQYLDLKDVTQKDFAEDSQHGIQFDRGRLGKASGSGAKIGADVVEKFLRKFPEVNPYWLILGKGEITINTGLIEANQILESSYVATLKDAIKNLGENLNDLRGRIEDKEKIIMLLESRA